MSGSAPAPAGPDSGLRVAGLFAGIGGVELGLHGAGHRTVVLCEIDEPARRVLRARFAETPLVGDIRSLPALPRVDLVAAGFPCQDLSQAGRTAGISGARSGLVSEVFRLLGKARGKAQPRWLLLENVPFMLQLERGQAMAYLTRELSARGYRWAYRVVETRSFGLPQRRRRVLLLASRTEDPRPVLFADDVGELAPEHVFSDNKRGVLGSDSDSDNDSHGGVACSFYWTEGLRGLGWAVDATPTLKGGSSVGIPSAPAIIMPSGLVGTPDIRDAERLQGFPEAWTAPAVDAPEKRNGPRWKLVGNAVSVPVARWLGERLQQPGSHHVDGDRPYRAGTPWPKAAWSMGGPVYIARVSMWPRREPHTPLGEFLRYPLTPLSLRATAGFLSRAERSSLRFPDRFLEIVARHLHRQSQLSGC